MTIVRALAVCAFLGSAGSAQGASDEERAAARSMAEQGVQAFGAKNYEAAVDLFGRAESLIHSPVHLLYLARSNAALGHLVKAQEAYIKVSRETLGPDSPPAFRKAVDQANSELDALKPRISYATVSVHGADNASVTVDGQPVAPALVGVPMPLDPGTHQFEAHADGMQAATAELTMSEGHTGQVELTLTPVPVAPRSAVSRPPAAGAPPAQDDSDTEMMRYGAYGSFGLGAVGLGLGTVFALASHSKSQSADDAFAACSAQRGGCSARDQDDVQKLDDQAAHKLTTSVVGFAVGGVGIAAGITLLVLAAHHDDTAQNEQPRVIPWVGWQSVGVSGRF
ncbi:MAG TPA: hypothetical protein VHM70_15355 [Polyangiaceae bacterium]|jgi:hypothetical protein|nr:hypothetical protein [Polyangiaceae bacterium]